MKGKTNEVKTLTLALCWEEFSKKQHRRELKQKMVISMSLRQIRFWGSECSWKLWGRIQKRREYIEKGSRNLRCPLESIVEV